MSSRGKKKKDKKFKLQTELMSNCYTRPASCPYLKEKDSIIQCGGGYRYSSSIHRLLCS